MLPTSFAFSKSANHKFLLRPGRDLEPIGTPFPRPVNAVFALGHCALHAFRFGKIKERFALTLHKSSKLNAVRRFYIGFQYGSTFHQCFPSDVHPVGPKHVENEIQRRSYRLLLESLEQLKAGNAVLIYGNNIAIENGRTQLQERRRRSCDSV